MLELNGDIFYKVFEVGKIPSYMDPKKRYNEDYIFQVAKNYDPVNVHEAPFWVGHPEYMSEPRAGGWIKKVVAVGRELYVSFSEILPWMKELYDSGEFKKCSVEMGDLEINSEGESIPYLWALGATNIPAVKGLEPLKFSGHKRFEETKLLNKVCFSLINFDYKIKTKSKSMESIKKLADSIGVKYTDDTSENDLTTAVETKLTEIKASEEKARQDLASLKSESVVKLVDDAIKSGQITPGQKDEFTAFAQSNFSQCEKVLTSLPKKDFTDKSIKTGGATGGKPAAADLSNVTYEDVLRSPDKFIGVLSEEQIFSLRRSSTSFKDAPLLD